MRKLLIGLLVLLPVAAFASYGQNKSVGISIVRDWNQYARLGIPIWGHSHTVSTADRLVTNDDSTPGTLTNIRLFAWGSTVRVTCEADALVCPTQTGTISLTTTGRLDDSTPVDIDGPAACMKFEAGVPGDFFVTREIFEQSTAPGQRSGYCTNSNVLYAGYPCRVTSDCPSSGTCVTSGANPKQFIRGTFLATIASSATTCFMTEMR